MQAQFLPNHVQGLGSNCTYFTASYIIRTSTYQCEDPQSEDDFSTVLLLIEVKGSERELCEETYSHSSLTLITDNVEQPVVLY